MIIKISTGDDCLRSPPAARASHDRIVYRPDDALLFGPERQGLRDAVLDDIPEAQRLRIPMLAGSRSLNLANAVAVVHEAWRQLDFDGAGDGGRTP